MEIIVHREIVRGYKGWHINATNGFVATDNLNTSNTKKARAHVESLLKRGYIIHKFSIEAWETLKQES